MGRNWKSLQVEGKIAVQFYSALYRSEYKENEGLSAKFYDGLPDMQDSSKTW